MIKRQLEALMSAYNQLVQPINKFEELLDIADKYIEAVQAGNHEKNCLLCKYFNEAMGETCNAPCTIPPTRPPAWVIVQGCKAFEHKDFDAQDKAAEEKDVKRYNTKSGFARDLDDEVPF